MTNRSSITLAIPARNASGTLATCLGHIRASTVTPIRVLVLDDGSIDATASIARAAGAEIVPVPPPGGIGAARNIALQRCRTRFLAFLNADCYPRPDWLERLLEALTTSQAAVAGGRQLEGNRCSLAERWKAVHLRQDLGCTALRNPDFLSGGNLLLDKHALHGLEFDTDRMVAHEDVDFCRRVRAAGSTLRYEPAAVVRHDHAETLRTLPAKVWSYGAASRAARPRPGFAAPLQAFVRMHARPHDHVVSAFRSDWRERRPVFLLVDVYLLAGSLALFVAAALAPGRIRGAPADLARRARHG